MRDLALSINTQLLPDALSTRDPRFAINNRRLTEPTGLPLSVEEARTQLRIDDERLDGLIQIWVQGLTAHLEQITQRALLFQRWQFSYAQFSEDMYLPIAPVVAIESITYLDTQGQLQTLDPSRFELIQNSVRARLKLRGSSPLPQTGSTSDTEPAVEIICQCGYGDDPSHIPSNLRLYLMMRLVEQFDSASQGLSPAQTSFAEYLLEPYRVLHAG